MGNSIKNIIILSLAFTLLSLAILWLYTPEKTENAETVPSETSREAAVSPPSAEVPEMTAGEQPAVGSAVVEAAVEESGPAAGSVSVDETPQPADAASHITLGMQYYRNNDLQKAVWHLQEALRIEPENRTAKAAMEKVSREARVENGFTSKEGSHFSVRYEGGENDVAGHVVAIILEEAYQKVGSDLGFYPEDSITTILYSAEQFRDVTRAPSWSGAIYDGKLRIPVGGVRERTDVLEKVLFHEYTHAVIHRMGGGRVPTWLNEGIAQYEEGRLGDSEDVFRYLASADKLVPLSYLEGSFMGLNQQQAMVAYAEGLSAVKYIIDEYGLGMLTRLVSGYRDGKGSEAVMKETFQMTYKEFQECWVRNLKKRYGSIERTVTPRA